MHNACCAVTVVVYWLYQKEAIQVLIFNTEIISVAIIEKKKVLYTYKNSVSCNGNKVWT